MILWKSYRNFGRILAKINIDDKDKRDKIETEAWAKPDVEGRRRFTITFSTGVKECAYIYKNKAHARTARVLFFIVKNFAGITARVSRI